MPSATVYMVCQEALSGEGFLIEGDGFRLALEIVNGNIRISRNEAICEAPMPIPAFNTPKANLDESAMKAFGVCHARTLPASPSYLSVASLPQLCC